MKRVLIVGSPGAGKSTFAKKLAARTGLPLTHLDDLSWEPGWVRVERSVWHARLAEATAQDRWILDGNILTTLLRVAYRADTVVYLLPPRWLCLWRIYQRAAIGQFPHGERWQGWPTRELLRSVWQFPAQADWQLAQLRTVPGLRLVVLRSDAEARAFLARLPGGWATLHP